MAVDGWREVVHQVGQGRADGGVVLRTDHDKTVQKKLFKQI